MIGDRAAGANPDHEISTRCRAMRMWLLDPDPRQLTAEIRFSESLIDLKTGEQSDSHPWKDHRFNIVRPRHRHISRKRCPHRFR
jgi:hypothetical protein